MKCSKVALTDECERNNGWLIWHNQASLLLKLEASGLFQGCVPFGMDWSFWTSLLFKLEALGLYFLRVGLTL